MKGCIRIFFLLNCIDNWDFFPNIIGFTMKIKLTWRNCFFLLPVVFLDKTFCAKSRLLKDQYPKHPYVTLNYNLMYAMTCL